MAAMDKGHGRNVNSAESNVQYLPWKYIQSSVAERWNVLAELRQILWSKPRDASLRDLQTILKVRGDLGKGVYGKVYDVVLTSSLRERMPHHFALKIVSVNDCKSERQDLIMKVMRENQAFGYTNALVFLRICPNFTLVPRAFFTKNKKHRRASYFCCLIVMERENGNMKEFLDLSNNVQNARLMMSAILQVMMAIVSCAKHLRLCHNDLYLKNILYCAMQPTNMLYKLSDQYYHIPNCSYIFKMSDFGIASSPDYLNNRHTDMNHLVTINRAAKSMRTYEFKYHILEYQNVQPYARDICVFLRSLTLVNDLDANVQRWVNNALHTLDQYCNENRMNSHMGPAKFVEDIFSPTFLHNSNLSSKLFSLPDNRIPRDTEIFDVDGPPDIAKRLVWLASDHQFGYTTNNAAEKPIGK